MARGGKLFLFQKVVWVTHATPSSSQTCLFIVCLEASLCPLPYKVANDGLFVAKGLFLSFLFSLF
jgi:hypothetical protein